MIKVLPPDVLPTVTMTSPADGGTYAPRPNITLAADASDPDGRVTKVEFYDNGTIRARDTTAPYSFRWMSVPSGTHAFKAKATDDRGGAKTSAAVTVTVR
jgi:hypothetical protein